ncbi:helicase-related protein [Paenibacillus sp. WQ 127069]|uniref:Helicase-related protein n=1 Tax=Paenibacillus baimaensis TaxID=2982185 RepID=A0ABT2UCU7_9BACL|nr:helicase-related protein [Paenibacillus sp. WQ 127069]MCU6792464.1 helicase-related protein [Paenibacillus sp. WQ 127069]
MENKTELLNVRAELIEDLKRELLGPGSEYSIPDKDHEIITDLPEIRYSTGVLFPQKNPISSDNNELPEKMNSSPEDLEDEEIIENETKDEIVEKKRYSGSVAEDTDVGTLDEDIGLSMQNMPSSMGFTFFVKGNVNRLRFTVSFGTYRNAILEDCMLPFHPENPDDYAIPYKVAEIVKYSKEIGVLTLKSRLKRKDVGQITKDEEMDDPYLIDCLYRLSNQFEKGFVREPHQLQVNVALSDKDVYEKPGIDDKEIKMVILRKKHIGGIQSITALLVNTHQGGYNGRNSIMQPVIEISTVENPDIHFEVYSNREHANNNDSEEKSLELLYRDKKIYATGHGVSVNWNVDDTGHGSITTEYMPTYEVPQMDFDISRKKVDNKAFSMKFLSDLDNTDKKDKIISMRTLVDAYASWISDIQEESKRIDDRYKDTARGHILDCLDSCNRMYYGLDLLEKNEEAYVSFQLANRAMFMQRIHARIQKNDYYPDDSELQNTMASLNYYDCDDKEHQWRPFQLAFLLLSLRSIVEPECKERDLVDLIWFPTGGGKTEAYLGLTAVTIFYRRLTDLEKSGGTTVIMRYTLRLLAAQQFLRAGTLICACESIRKDCEKRREYPSYKLGKERITIGLWIGGTHTPNKNEDARKHLKSLLAVNKNDLREMKDRHNKFQILKCPWCGTKLVKDVDSTTGKLIGEWGYLMQNEKRFRMFCCQEGCEFETALPIQVVDEELYNNPPTLLFGTVDKFAMLPWKNDAGSFFATSSLNRTPELIIQDELHLISGPLGTIIGLYETAIDALCSSKGLKPKIIASTATIRRAKDQVSSLYNREVKQFPSPGIDANDSFFAYEADKIEKPGRMYVGIMPSGKTKAMMEVRTIAALLQRVHMMNLPYEIKDKFWTLAVYFNSLRDLSKCMTLVDDDVKDFIRRTAQRFGRSNSARPIGSADELTSRISTSQLNETLEKLEQLEYSKSNQEEKKYPINVLLATNMISVGVDVARLNVMLLVGQPKLTSEYIQASSRIGRTYPGVAFTLYDGSKSRDRSHYEQFKAYHESFYKYVEPTGVTPFSKPARDRALHAIIVSLMRHKYGISRDTDAAMFVQGMDGIKDIESYILSRIKEINDRLDFDFTDKTNEILKEMSEFWSDWKLKVEITEGKNFYYGDRYIASEPPSDSKRLMKAFGQESSDAAKETLTSMRNVDRSVRAGLIIWE